MQALTSDSNTADLSLEAIQILKKLISTPSVSGAEEDTAHLLETFLISKGVATRRKHNNVWALNEYFDAGLPTLLLNSHHDTVKPNPGYTRNPFEAKTEEGKIFGLGSNDAGGPLVALLAAFLYFHKRKNLRYNIAVAATAEEEISGVKGICSVLDELPPISFAIVGEPTQMHLAIAEKGLMVLDCLAQGVSGHAAREEGDNAIYKAIKDIEWFRDFKFPKVSETLGPVKMSVTQVKAGQQHNVIPAQCEFTVDIRTTDAYSNQELLDIITQNVSCRVKPRSLRLQPSSIDKEHAFVKAGVKLGRELYGSPTLSDQALMPWPSVKIGPGNSARSHSADEFIHLKEIEEGLELYIRLLNEIVY